MDDFGSYRLNRRRVQWRKRAERARLPFADLSVLRAEPRALAFVPRPLAERHGILPLKDACGVLYVATSCVSGDSAARRHENGDPHGTFMCSAERGDKQVADAIRGESAFSVRFLLASPGDIRAAINRDYPAARVHGENLDEAP